MTPSTPRLHGKAKLDPAAYAFEQAGDNQAASNLAANPPIGYASPDAMRLWAEQVAAERALYRELVESIHPNSLHKCTHCGAYVRYFNIFRHVPTGERIVIGDTCAEERMALDSRAALQSSLMHKAAVARAAQAKLNAEAHRWITAHEALWQGMVDNRGDEFVGKMIQAVAAYGNLTERQEAAVIRAIVKVGEWTQPGAICELRETQYGYRMVMTVTTDAGWLVWGTCPASITDVSDLRGKRVRFVADLERSPGKANIAFTSRPRKAEVLESEAVCA